MMSPRDASSPSEGDESLPPAGGHWSQELASGRLVVARCHAEDHCWIPVTTRCPDCGTTEWSEHLASGYGSVYSWATVHRSATPASDLPYTIIDVALDEGPRVYGRLTQGATPEPSQRVVFDPDETFRLQRLSFQPLDDV
ncbi:MAG: hypothetical protein F4Y28_13625 [Acidimicrobiia bacterium]|nr:hypothetical protein [Acidimicrobiia bacterium]